MRPPFARRLTTRLGAALAVCAVALGVLLTGGAAIAESTDDEQKKQPVVELTDDELRKQQKQAAKLAETAKRKVATSEQGRERLKELAVEAGRHLEAFAVASGQAHKARAQEAEERARYDDAIAVVRAHRVALGRYAASAYRNGGSQGDMALIATVLSARSVTEVGRAAADLEWAGAQQSHAIDRLEAAKLVAARSAAAATAAAERATSAEQRAKEAQEAAQALVAEQDAIVVLLDQAAAAALDAAAAAKTKAKQMEKARLVAARYRAEAERQRRLALGRGEVVQILVDGSCPGGDISDSPNGQIDRSLLCPLWGAEWHILRADAAATFNLMSKAYAEKFGRPICVTDSYRSLEAQIDVHKRKPNMTAIPGTSNHGWGTAVDLCDGVETFGTETFTWMQVNAPRFHWYHPSWAVQGGGREEPWHWEFAG